MPLFQKQSIEHLLDGRYSAKFRGYRSAEDSQNLGTSVAIGWQKSDKYHLYYKEEQIFSSKMTHYSEAIVFFVLPGSSLSFVLDEEPELELSTCFPAKE